MVKANKLQKKKALLLLGVVLLIVVGIIRNQLSSIFSIFYGVTIDRAINLTSRQKEAFNIAVLGIGGARHDGPDLSDTIIMANVNLKQNKVHMFSIPRDLWLKGDADKVNSIYAKEKLEGGGIPAVGDMLSYITGQRIDYVVVIDFEGFAKLVDYLGGIDLVVASRLDDDHYPVDGKEDDNCGKTEDEISAFIATNSAETEIWDYFPCRYKRLQVERGLQHMNGQEALEFVRSRHGVGFEGSDFARSRRQQLVISALREKAFSLGVILNPVKLIGIYNILKENIDTNINIEKVDDFIKLADKLKEGEVKNYVIDEGNSANKNGLLINPPITDEYRLKWVLIPRKGNGDFSEIKQYVLCIIENNICEVTKKGIITVTPTVLPDNE